MLGKQLSQVSVCNVAQSCKGLARNLRETPFTFRPYFRLVIGIPTRPAPHIRNLRSDVYRSVRSGECPVGLVPQENSIHGIVIETYDLLRIPDFGREVFVRGEVAISIQHCLITRKGVVLEDVKRVYSHEQVRVNLDRVHCTRRSIIKN